MKKSKRILAIIGVILLLGLYVCTFVLAITASAQTMNMLMASIVATILIPVVIFIYTRMVDAFKRGQDEDDEE